MSEINSIRYKIKQTIYFMNHLICFMNTSKTLSIPSHRMMTSMQPVITVNSDQAQLIDTQNIF